MHVMIDTTNGRALARHESRAALAALHFIQFANVDMVVLAEGENRPWAALDAQQLTSILQQANVTSLPPQYNELLKLTRQVVESAEWLLLPFDADALVAQARKINAYDLRAYRYAPGQDMPHQLEKWCSVPQRAPRRVDAMFWRVYTLQEHEGGQPVVAYGTKRQSSATLPKRNPAPISQHEDTTMAATKKAPAAPAAPKKAPAAPAKKAASKKAPAAPAKKAAGKTAAVAQEERNGVKRPKPGGNTAKVWDTCDKLFTDKKHPPSFGKVYAKLENTDIPDATIRSNYAVWRKFHGITGRVSD